MWDALYVLVFGETGGPAAHESRLEGEREAYSVHCIDFTLQAAVDRRGQNLSPLRLDVPDTVLPM
jgi:hypothetical protein